MEQIDYKIRVKKEFKSKIKFEVNQVVRKSRTTSRKKQNFAN